MSGFRLLGRQSAQLRRGQCGDLDRGQAFDGVFVERIELVEGEADDRPLAMALSCWELSASTSSTSSAAIWEEERALTCAVDSEAMSSVVHAATAAEERDLICVIVSVRQIVVMLINPECSNGVNKKPGRNSDSERWRLPIQGLIEESAIQPAQLRTAKSGCVVGLEPEIAGGLPNRFRARCRDEG